MNKYNHYTVRQSAEFCVEDYGTEKGCEKEFKKKVKILIKVAKALGIEVWVDEILTEE